MYHIPATRAVFFLAKNDMHHTDLYCFLQPAGRWALKISVSAKLQFSSVFDGRTSFRAKGLRGQVGKISLQYLGENAFLQKTATAIR